MFFFCFFLSTSFITPVQAAIQTGQCDPSCDAFIDICGECFPLYSPPPPPLTTPPPPPQTPTCPGRCREAVRTGQCDPSCEQYTDICGPCVQTCPAKCKATIQSGVCDPSCFQYADVCGPCIPSTTVRPTPPPAAYLPPPGQGGSARSFSGNSLALPPRSNFARKFSPRRKQQAGARAAGRRRNQRQLQPVSQPRNNWDLFFRTGIVAKKG